MRSTASPGQPAAPASASTPASARAAAAGASTAQATAKAEARAEARAQDQAEVDATSGRPLRRDAVRNRLRIIAAAREVFAERGLVATLDEVARRAEVGVGTVYRRFPDKESLIDALFEQSIDDVAELAESCLAEPDSWAGLVRFVEGTCAMNADDRGFKGVLLGTSYGRCRVAGAKARLVPLVRQIVERAQADGRLRPDVSATDIPLLNFALGSVVEYTDQGRPDVWRRFLTIMLDGLRADGTARSPMPVPALSEDDLTDVMSCWPRRRP